MRSLGHHAAANGGLPTVNASNYVAGIAGTKNTFDSLNDLSSAQVTALGLDAPVSSRLAGVDYVAADNAGIAAASAGVADLLTRLTTTRAALLDSLAHLDADISSRMAAAAYTAPDNTGIALANTSIGNAIVGITNAIAGINVVQAKTDNLPAHPAATGDQMTFDLAQPVPLVNTAQTIGDALNAACGGVWPMGGRCRLCPAHHDLLRPRRNNACPYLPARFCGRSHTEKLTCRTPLPPTDQPMGTAAHGPVPFRGPSIAELRRSSRQKVLEQAAHKVWRGRSLLACNRPNRVWRRNG